MNNCENCKKEHSGEYGSGRFCSCKCARGFSTKAKRIEINEKVSKTLKNRPIWNNSGFNQGYDKRRHKFVDEDRVKALDKRQINLKEKYNTTPLCDQPKNKIRDKILEEQDNKCNICGINIWNDEKIIIELHHKDGNKKNNIRENLCGLCPNCYNQTKIKKDHPMNKIGELASTGNAPGLNPEVSREYPVSVRIVYSPQNNLISRIDEIGSHVCLRSIC